MTVIPFEKWRANNPTLHNWQPCPLCNGSGADPIDDEDLCISCNGAGKVDDLSTLYNNDIERDTIVYICPTCGANQSMPGRTRPPVYCDECGADWKQ